MTQPDLAACPCGSGRAFADCCGPLIAGAAAPTAEALMRSRYTAHVRGAVDYIVDTHDAATRGTLDRRAIGGLLGAAMGRLSSFIDNGAV